MDFTYVALKRMKVGDEIRLPGELVPEAETWLRKETYVSQGFLAMVEKRKGPGRPRAEIQDAK